ncbi:MULTISPECIES: Rv3235 family protein [Streptomyces]|uniref:Rv3235 family protein n=1 Tax=Streptomyces desertarenae TaxID=2666184 RepID=A0ABW4PR11_9ACTN
MPSTSRTAPPGRRDSRRPARPAHSAVLAARQRERDRQPHYWFAHRLVLVLSGLRPVHLLLGHTRGQAYEQLARLAPHAPLRPAAAGAPAPAVRQVGWCRPGPGAVEAFARITAGDRLRALAFRLEQGRDGRWLCCAVELDAPGTPGTAAGRTPGPGPGRVPAR